MNSRVFRLQRLFSIGTCFLVVLGVNVARAGETCAGTSPYVCVERADLSPPLAEFDFFFDFTDAANPDVTFKTGSSTIPWRVWSQVSASDTTPANLGDLFIDSSGSTDNYTVEILNPNECSGGICTAGAANLKSAVLDGTTNWTGHSSIGNATISGDLTGALEVIESGGGGVAGTLRIEGDAHGAITIPTVNVLVINGDATAGICTVTVTQALLILGNLSANLSVTGAVDGARLEVGGNVTSASTITIADIVGRSPGVSFNLNEEAGVLEFAGDLILENGVPSDQNVFIRGETKNTATIDLVGAGVAGFLDLHGGGAATIVNGGAVSGVVWVSSSNFCPAGRCDYSGVATFSSVAPLALIRTEFSDLSGTIEVTGAMAGTVGVLPGTFASTGKIWIQGAVTGFVHCAGITQGAIVLDGALSSGGGVRIQEKAIVGGGGDLAGPLTIGSHCFGDVDIENDLASTGLVDIGGYLMGDVLVGGNADGPIDVGKSVRSTGRILITGMLNEAITVSDGSVAGSLIRAVDGIGTGGSVTINDARGAFDAHGSMFFGDPVTIGAEATTFDGKVVIKDTSLGAYGKLEGSLTVKGCHATVDDLDICICGTGSRNNPTIVQALCAIQVVDSCVSGCP